MKTNDNQVMQQRMCQQEDIMDGLNQNKICLQNDIQNLNKIKEQQLNDIQKLNMQINS